MMKGEGFKDNIHVENYLVKRDLDLLLNIYDHAEFLAKTKAKEMRTEIDNIYDKLITENKDPLTKEEEKVHEDFINYAFHFNYLTLHSLFISAYSFLEEHLLKVTKQLENYSYTAIKIKDMSKDKSDLDRIRKYLNLVHNLSSASTDNSNWAILLKFQKIRNLIVHNGNRFKDDGNRESLINFLKKYKAHIPRDYSFHIKDREFLVDFNKAVSDYSDSLVTEIYQINIQTP